MFVKRHTVTVITAADGTATAYTSEIVNGEIRQIVYTKNDFANGVDFTITIENTAEGLWTESDVNASAVKAPRMATHSVLGVATLYAGGGSAVLDKIVVANSRIKIVIAQGGNVKTGTFDILVG